MDSTTLIVSVIDVLSFQCEGVVAAATFGFRNYTALEMNSKSYAVAVEIISQQSTLGQRVSIIQGSMQDYFPFHAEVVFANTTVLQGSLCDEGILLSLLFRLAHRMLPGSYLLVLSSLPSLDAAADFGVDFKRLSVIGVQAKGSISQYSLCIFQTSARLTLPQNS
jgi:hypothetical protein